MTAVLMSALFTLVAAPIALAATSWPTTVTVPRGGASTNTLVYSATENFAACFNLIALPAGRPGAEHRHHGQRGRLDRALHGHAQHGRHRRQPRRDGGPCDWGSCRTTP